MNTVLLDQSDGVATVTLNRPQRLNAITSELIDDLLAALEAAMNDPEVRAIILTGAGERAFCAGDDLREPHLGAEADFRRQIDRLQDISRAIIYGEKPVVAAVNGWAVGGGLEWVTNCDLAIWAEHAQAFFPEVSLGLGVTGGVTSLLPQMVGPQRARALFFLGEKQSAQTMLGLGLAHAVVPADRLMVEARRIATRLAALPPAALRQLKRALAIVSRDEIERALAAETAALVPLITDPDTAARIARFSTRSG